MIQNTSIKEINEMIEEAKSILLFPHVNADGDAIGSCVGLCLAMRQQGKESWIVTEEELPQYIQFVDRGCCTLDKDILEGPDLCICMDCSDSKRLGSRMEKFSSGKVTLCVDHHVSREGFGQHYYIDESQAATAQIAYMILEGMDISFSRDITNAIFTGISTDTGNFRYSNTTWQTHQIASELLKKGVDHNDIIVNIYQNKDRRELAVKGRVFGEAEFFAGGRCAIGCASQELLREIGALEEHAETAIDDLRDAKGVEIAALLKEREDGNIKVSLRAKSGGNVEKIATMFGGGGHVKAAGFTVDKTMEEVKDMIRIPMEEACSHKE